MAQDDAEQTVGALATPPDAQVGFGPRASTSLVWTFFAASLVALVMPLGFGGAELVGGAVTIDGLTLVMWPVVGFFSAIVHTYSLRYMAGDEGSGRFFGNLFAFTVAVAVLVAANHVALFAAAWGAMGFVMSRLIGHRRSWDDARAAGRHALAYFGVSTALVGIGLGYGVYRTGAATLSEIVGQVGALSPTTVGIVSATLVLAAMVQSALLPFHSWLLGSMTAPTPASALMHAGFVNAGGILMARVAPVVSEASVVLAALLGIGAVSALGGKLLKSVQIDAKGRLGCSTIGQMGFMLMQAGLGLFGAAITHLILHGFYKAYLFLSVGETVETEAPTGGDDDLGGRGVAAGVILAASGGALFAWLTGKGTTPDSGALLTVLVVLTTFRAAREAVAARNVPAAFRYGAVAAVFLPTIALYAGVYKMISLALAGVPAISAPTSLGPLHFAVTLLFVAVYVVVETGVYKRSPRLYVLLRNLARPPSDTLLNARETLHGSR